MEGEAAPDEHGAGRGGVGLGVHWGVGHAHQHHVVLANPGGGDLGGEEDVEEHVAEVGVRADQKLGPAAIN